MASDAQNFHNLPNTPEASPLPPTFEPPASVGPAAPIDIPPSAPPAVPPLPMRNLPRKGTGAQRWLVIALLLVLTGETIARQRHLLRAYPRLDLASNSYLSNPLDPVEAAVASAAGHPAQPIQSVTEEYAKTTVRDDWRGVIEYFLRDVPVDLFRPSAIEQHYEQDVNNAQQTCMLVTITDGEVHFTERYGKAHGRAASVRYILRKIAARKKHILRNVTVLVMLSDGHRPRVPTIGSARHWTNWNFMIPAPIGNFRGHFQGWGSPLENWDQYVEEHITSTHKDYPWKSKIGKAVFRGALAMQTYTLGSCNEINGRECKGATRWDQVNRGVLYKESRKRLDLFDVGFSQLKPKLAIGPNQFEGAPKKAPPIDFRDFQKYKYVINVGSNQGTPLPPSTFPHCHFYD